MLEVTKIGSGGLIEEENDNKEKETIIRKQRKQITNTDSKILT